MTKSLKILFTPFDAVGHVNSAIGMAEVLIARGHKVIFVISEQWRGRLTKYGIEERILPLNDNHSNEEPAQRWADIFFKNNLLKRTPLEVAIHTRKEFNSIGQDIKDNEPAMQQFLRSIAPDVVIVDQLLSIPSVELSAIPWVKVCSCNPLLYLNDPNLPPWSSGLPTKGAETECIIFKKKLDNATEESWKEWNDYVVSRGLDPLKYCTYMADSKWLNIYGIPSEMDYTDSSPLPPKWYRFDNLKRTDKHFDFQIPEQLRGKPGKLIFLSMGSMGSADIDLMKRLVAILSKSKHRFIVSKGLSHNQYELPDNMWGQQSVPQIQVLSSVDLVITHGGNNTVTETFFFGKPMIVMPLLGDQLDNAQRIHEKGFGIRLSPYHCTEEELLTAIESLLNDKQLNEKLKKISERIQTENSIAKVAQLIENLVK